MALSALPVEVLANVLKYIPSSEGFLLLATCPNFHKKLSQPTAVRFYEPNLPAAQFVEGKITIHLPLQSLVLEDLRYDGYHSLDLKRLPRSLERLTLTFGSCYWDLLVQNDETAPTLVNFPVHLPNLRTLVCRGADLALGHILLPQYPHTLTSLSLSHSAVVLPDYAPAYGPAPPNLLELRLLSAELLRKDMVSRCHQLEILAFGVDSVCLLPELPSSLTSLEISVDEETNLSAIETLSRTNLKSLAVTGPGEAVLLFLQHAPPSVTKLTIGCFDLQEAVPWPPKLETLILNHAVFDGFQAIISGTPPTLSKLSVNFLSAPRNLPVIASPFPGDWLPTKHLTRLELTGIAFAPNTIPSDLLCLTSCGVAIENAAECAQLPSKVQDLHIWLYPGFSVGGTWKLPQNIGRVSFRSFAMDSGPEIARRMLDDLKPEMERMGLSYGVYNSRRAVQFSRYRTDI